MVELSTLGAVIKQAYEGEPDTNGFTDAEKAKLAAMTEFSGSYSDLTNKPALDFIASLQKGQANGVAPLDAAGFVPMRHLNVSGLSFKGAWNPNTNTPTLIDGTGAVGDFYKASASGTFNFGNGSYTFNQGDWAIFAAGVWQRIGSSELVASVNGKIGDVVLTASDVGALPSTYQAPVSTVNSKSGAVVLSASDVGALPSTYAPTWANVTGKPAFDTLYQAKQRGTIGPAIPAALARPSVNQAIPNGTSTLVNWGALVYDQFSMRTSGNSFVVPSWAKFARVTGHVQWGGDSGSSASVITVQVRVNGAEVPGAARGRAPTTIQVLSVPFSTGVIPVVAGDILTLAVSQSSSTTRNVEVGAGNAGTWLQIELYE